MLETIFIAGAAQAMTRANQAQLSGEMASRVASQVRTQNDFIIADVENLFLITKALWTILKEEHGYTDDILLKKITEIDGEDGKLDGKITKTETQRCPKCGRKLIKKQSTCLFCETPITQDPFGR